MKKYRDHGEEIADALRQHEEEKAMAEKKMTKVQVLIHMATKQAGTYNPDEALPYVEEQMTVDEAREAQAFLTWVVKTKARFGWNLPEVWAQWKKETCRHYWVNSGTGLRCLICRSRRKARIGG